MRVGDDTRDLDATYHHELCGQEQRVRLAVDRLGPEVEILHRTGEPLELGQKRRKVEGEKAREKKSPDEALPCLDNARET